MEFFNLSIYILLTFLLSLIISLVSFLVVFKQSDIEKISTYECGFDPFDINNRGKFDIRFYLVSILFLVFDIEVVYLFPWSVCIFHMDLFGFFVMFFFLFILIFGFIYEWKKGALDW